MTSRLFRDAQTEFDLEKDEGSSDNEVDHLITHKPQHRHVIKKAKPLSFEDKMIWYLRAIFLLLAAILGILIATLVTSLTVTTIITTSSQYSRAVNLIDRTHESFDYIKTMTDMAVGSQDKVTEAMQAYNIPNLMESVKTIATQGATLMNTIKPETLQKVSETGSRLVETLHQMDFEQAKQLMRHANEWADNIDPRKISKSIDEVDAFLKKSNEMMKVAQDGNLVQHVGEFAAGGVELEARLKRLNEITIKLP